MTVGGTRDMQRDSRPPRASIAEVARTVLAAFFGVRRRSRHEHDAARIAPWQIALVAIGFAALFIFTLITIVRVVVG